MKIQKVNLPNFIFYWTEYCKKKLTKIVAVTGLAVQCEYMFTNKSFTGLQVGNFYPSLANASSLKVVLVKWTVNSIINSNSKHLYLSYTNQCTFVFQCIQKSQLCAED